MLLITVRVNFLKHIKLLEKEKKTIEHRNTYSVSTFFHFCLLCVMFSFLFVICVLMYSFPDFLVGGERGVANQPKPRCQVTQVACHNLRLRGGTSPRPPPFTLPMATLCLPFAPFEMTVILFSRLRFRTRVLERACSLLWDFFLSVLNCMLASCPCE